jgi:hypothetical protein
MSSGKFWLYEWLDVFDVRNINDAKKLLEETNGRLALRERLAQVPFTTEPLPASNKVTVVAGRAIDLSGELDCFAWECLKKQVDTLFSHVWHYFDQIIVAGPSAHSLNKWWNDETEHQVLDRLLTYVRLLLYLRDIGAEEMLVFRQKRPPCEIHLEQHLEEIGIEPSLILANGMIDELARDALITTKPHLDHLDYTFIHPEFEHTVWGAIRKSEASAISEMAIRRAVTTSVYKSYLSRLASDIWTAQTLKSSLGSTIHLHGQLLNAFKRGLAEGDVAFNLDLPVLNGVTPEVLLRIRRDEKLHFEKFRQSLRLAIKERLQADSPGKATVIATEVRRDVIDPALNEIERRLAGAKKVLAKKASISISLGALATTCGLLTANPVLVTTGITTAVGGGLNAEYKFIEEERDIKLSDMYFLWQAQKHSEKHKSV